MSSKRLCPACDKPFIKGVRVLFAARTGARGATVCKRCADGGLLVVQDRSGDLTRCFYCEDNAAVCCLACAQLPPKERFKKQTTVRS
jgi:hypothetical protein